MTVTKTIQYLRTKKKLLKKYALAEDVIEATIGLFQVDYSASLLHYKKMTCKKDKDRYSIRILNTQYRILMTVINEEAFFLCICSHDDYDRLNKDC
jgi:plasmid maintenance system killer protein